MIINLPRFHEVDFVSATFRKFVNLGSMFAVFVFAIACGAATTYHSIPGPFQLRGPDQFGVKLEAIAMLGSEFVMVGDIGFVGKSLDAHSWTSRQLQCDESYRCILPIEDGFLIGGAYGDNRSLQGAIWHSTDTRRFMELFSTRYPILQIATGPEGYIASSGSIYLGGLEWHQSGNGLDWKNVSPTRVDAPDPSFPAIRDLRADKFGYHVLTWDGEILESANGLEWKKRALLPTGVVWSAFFKSGSTWLLASTTGSIYGSNDDGRFWTSWPLATNERISLVSAHDSEFVAVSKTGRLWTFNSMGPWNQQTPIANASYKDIRFLKDRWIAYGTAGDLIVSTNLQEWTVISSHSSYIYTMAATERGFVGFSRYKRHNSVDGTNWVVTPSPLIATVCAGKGRFVAAGDGIYSSEDGYEWTPRLPNYNETNGTLLIYSSDRFLAGESLEGLGKIYESKDGIHWSLVASNIAAPFNMIVDFGNTPVYSGYWIGNSYTGWNRAVSFQDRLDEIQGMVVAVTTKSGVYGMTEVGGMFQLPLIFPDPELEDPPFYPKIHPYQMSYAEPFIFGFGLSKKGYQARTYMAHDRTGFVWQNIHPFLSTTFSCAAINSSGLVIAGQGILQTTLTNSLDCPPMLDLVQNKEGINVEWFGQQNILYQLFLSEDLKTWTPYEYESSGRNTRDIWGEEEWISIPFPVGKGAKHFRVKTVPVTEWFSP